MSKSLYALMSEAATKEQVLLEHDGDLDAPEVQEILAVTEVHIPAKVDGYKLTIDRFRAMGDYLAGQEKIIATMKKRMYGAADRIEENMIKIMETAGVDALDGAQFEARIKLNPFSVDVVDETLLPQEAFKTTVEVSASRIKLLFKDGPVPGARLIRKKKLEMRPATRKVGGNV